VEYEWLRLRLRNAGDFDEERMTQDDIVRMAQEAGLVDDYEPYE
jgi:hypothetical protein